MKKQRRSKEMEWWKKDFFVAGSGVQIFGWQGWKVGIFWRGYVFLVSWFYTPPGALFV
jgi:hypothetical protein